MNAFELINKVIKLEFAMFMNVNAEGNPSCRESPESFRLHRLSQFSVWSKNTLRSYLVDLETAEAGGRNLMTYKYARMDNLITSENDSPLIGKIVAEQMNWQRRIIREYPKLMKNARGLTDTDDSLLDVSFERYLRAELESYSEATLEYLWNDVSNYKKDGINMSEQVYLSLVKQLGLDSLEDFK